jgi:hypothetical protein
MSDANKQMPVIGAQAADAAQHDEELLKVAMNAQVQAFVGQRDEALQRAADLFSQLSVTEAMLQRLQKENIELKLDVDALKQSAGIPSKAAAPAS